MTTLPHHRALDIGPSTSAVLARLGEHAATRTKSTAMRDSAADGEERTTNWGELERAVASLAERLRKMDAPGRVVMLSCPNRAEFVAAFLAVLAADAWVMPVHPRLTASELRALAARCEARAIIATDETLESLAGAGVAPIRVESVLCDTRMPPLSRFRSGGGRGGLYLQSSGTTGLPRIAIRSAASLDAVAANVAWAAALKTTDEVLACIPLGHSYGLENGLLGPVWAGTCIRIVDGFDPHVVRRHLRESSSVFPGVPFMFDALAPSEITLQAERDGAPVPVAEDALRLCYSAGSPLPSAVAERFQHRFRVSVGQLYGATEIGSVTFNETAPGEFHPRCVGGPLPGVRILTLDSMNPDVERPLPPGVEGQVAVFAPSMLDGYLDGEVPVTGGFFLTGDLGRIDEHSRLWITGRLKLQIDVGGLKVNPAEVEEALLEHPAVAECVVVAMPLSSTIARVRAIVVAAADRQVSEEELRAFLSERLAPYKIPRRIQFRAALPRSPLGKLLRREIEQS